MILTLKELADYLRVNERTILRMLKSGQIKGIKVGGQWRFNGSHVDGMFFPEQKEKKSTKPSDGAVSAHVQKLGLPLSRLMREDRMLLDLDVNGVEDFFEKIIKEDFFDSIFNDVEELKERLLARENLLSTGVGNGVAIPHPREPVLSMRENAVVVFVRTRKAIEFNAVDDEPVNLFFIPICRNIESHLQIMGKLANILRDEEFIETCLNAEDGTDVMRYLLEAERKEFLA